MKGAIVFGEARGCGGFPVKKQGSVMVFALDAAGVGC